MFTGGKEALACVLGLRDTQISDDVKTQSRKTMESSAWLFKSNSHYAYVYAYVYSEVKVGKMTVGK